MLMGSMLLVFGFTPTSMLHTTLWYKREKFARGRTSCALCSGLFQKIKKKSARQYMGYVASLRLFGVSVTNDGCLTGPSYVGIVGYWVNSEYIICSRRTGTSQGFFVVARDLSMSGIPPSLPFSLPVALLWYGMVWYHRAQ